MLRVKTRKQIDVDDWDDLVTSTYNKVYSFQQQNDCKSRGIESIVVPAVPRDFKRKEIPFTLNGDKMGVSFETWLNTSPEDTKKYFGSSWENDLFWDRNFYPHVSMIINDLYSKGILEAGEYDIKIDW